MRIFGFEIKRRSIESPRYPLTWAGISDFVGGKTASGVSVTPDRAAQLITVYACVSIISSTLATLPLSVYRRTADGKVPAPDHPLQRLLHDEPNPMQSSVQFREYLQSQLLLHGNAYAEIEFDGARRPVALWPLPSRLVTVTLETDGKQRYRVFDFQLPDGRRERLIDGEILHVPGLSFDGVVGKSPIQLARQAVGLALAAEEYGARLFANGITAGGVLEVPNALSDTAFARLQAAMEARRGLSHAHREMILEEGTKWKQVSINPEDAQFLETRKFQRSEIAALFRVPPHMIGDLEKSSFSNIEQQSLEFEKHTMRQWIVRWEQEINRTLFRGQDYFAHFNVDGLLRGDIRTRNEAYALGRQWGWLSVNDIRRLEDMNPVDGGDDYLVPLNMASAAGGSPDGRVRARDLYDLLARILKRMENGHERD